MCARAKKQENAIDGVTIATREDTAPATLALRARYADATRCDTGGIR